MNSRLNEERFSSSIAVDMSSSAISSRLREASELHELGLSLAKAKPMANGPQSPVETEAKSPSKLQSTADSRQ
jgi:hypothetical protein